jgi:hypothetical protein
MMYTLTVNPDGPTTIQVDFADEGVGVQGQTSIKGGEAEALRYLPVFETDLRRNFADLFPVPEIPPGGEML